MTNVLLNVLLKHRKLSNLFCKQDALLVTVTIQNKGYFLPMADCQWLVKCLQSCYWRGMAQSIAVKHKMPCNTMQARPLARQPFPCTFVTPHGMWLRLKWRPEMWHPR